MRRSFFLLFLFLLILGPAFWAPWRWVVGVPWVDGYGTQWFYWFAGEVAAGRQAFAHSDLFFYPWGKDIYLHTGGNLLDAVLALPLRDLFGPILGYNLWCLLILVGNYYGGCAVAGALGVPAARQWPAGLCLVLNPYVLQELQQGRPTQALLLFVALSSAALWKMDQRGFFGSLWSGAAAGFWMALAGFQYWYYGLMMGGLALVFGCWTLLFRFRIGALFGLSLGGAVALLMTLPMALSMLRSLEAGTVPGLLTMDGSGLIAPLALKSAEGDELGLYVLSLWDGTAGSLLGDGKIAYYGGHSILTGWWWAAFPLGLALLFRSQNYKKMSGGLLLWGLLCLAVASGPALVMGEPTLPNNLYLGLLEALPMMRRWWWPGRAVAAFWPLLAALVPILMWGMPVAVAPAAVPPVGKGWNWRYQVRLRRGEGEPELIAADAATRRLLTGPVEPQDGPTLLDDQGKPVLTDGAATPGPSEPPPPHSGAASEAPAATPTEGRYARFLWLRPYLMGAVLLSSTLFLLYQEGFLPVGRWDGRAGPVLSCLKAAPAGAVIDLPYVMQQENLYFQTIHQKPLLGGMLVTKAAFAPPQIAALKQGSPLLRSLVAVGERNYAGAVPALAEDRQQLLDLGYRYVLVQQAGFVRPSQGDREEVEWTSDWPRARRMLVNILGAEPGKEDERFALWTLDGAGLGCP